MSLCDLSEKYMSQKKKKKKNEFSPIFKISMYSMCVCQQRWEILENVAIELDSTNSEILKIHFATHFMFIQLIHRIWNAGE